MAGVRVETDKAVQVVKMLCEGIGVRSTGLTDHIWTVEELLL